MHIKQVIISGFRSFRTQNEIEPFRCVVFRKNIFFFMIQLSLHKHQSKTQCYRWPQWEREEVSCSSCIEHCRLSFWNERLCSYRCSNFFDAIQFVLLGPKFASLRQEDRQHLLHEGAGSSAMNAYVEIIFDNSDGRLTVESDEVVLRRVVGLKKDEFFLNRKRVQKSEVQSLLESAGFSKSNPYYIVQQGKVSNLCVMNDKKRLDLLKVK